MGFERTALPTFWDRIDPEYLNLPVPARVLSSFVFLDTTTSSISGRYRARLRLLDQQDAGVSLRCEKGRSLFGPGDAYPEILASLVIDIDSQVTSNNPIGIGGYCCIPVAWPSFENNDLIELLSFRLVHVHHDNAGFRLCVGREMLLNERLPHNLQRIWIVRSVSPVLRQRFA